MGQNNSAVGCNKWGHNVNEKVSAIVFNFSKKKKKCMSLFLPRWQIKAMDMSSAMPSV